MYQVIHSYILAVTVTLLILVILNLRLRVSMQMAALGGISGLIIALIYLFKTPLVEFLILSFLAAGLTGTSRLAMGHRWGELLSGFLLGLGVVLITILLV